MKIFIIAGEASGDKLGGALMDGLRQLRPDVQFEGIGGPVMAAQGLESRFPMDELSVMGLAEILPKYKALKARIRETAEAVITGEPDILITIDSPEFCHRVARLVKAVSTIRTVHYVAPTVWAWRPGRAVKMARYIDHVLALLPFEPQFMESAGIECDFVGHPVVAEPVATETEVEALGLAGKVVMLLPGSRLSEVSRLIDKFGVVAQLIAAETSGAHFVIPTTEGVYDLVKERSARWMVPYTVLEPGSAERAAYFKRADVAVAASGTVSLELAAAGTPMVIAYDMAWLSRVVIGAMLKINTVTLVNLVTKTITVPEFIGKACLAVPIAEAALRVLDHPQEQQEVLAKTMDLLGKGGEPPGLRAAKAVLERYDLACEQAAAERKTG